MEAPKIEGNIRRIVFVLCGFCLAKMGVRQLLLLPLVLGVYFFESKVDQSIVGDKDYSK